MPVGAIIGSTVLGVGGSIYSGIAGANAAKDAGNLQYQAAQDSLRLQEAIYNQNVARQEPLRQFGYSAIDPLAGLLGLPTGGGGGYPSPTPISVVGGGDQQYNQYVQSIPELLTEYNRVARQGNGFGVIPMDQYDLNGNNKLDIGEYGRWHYETFGQNSKDPQYRDFFSQQNAGGQTGGGGGAYGDSFTGDRMDWLRQTPGYQFALDEGNRNLAAQAGLGGSLNSGDRAKAAIEYGQNLASSVLTQERNALFTALGFGSAAATGQSAAGSQFANSASSTLAQQGQALANARLGQYQGINTAVQGGINAVNYGLGQITRLPGTQTTSSGGGSDSLILHNNSATTTPSTNPSAGYNA